MTTTSADLGYPSLLDKIKTTNPDGTQAQVVEAMTLLSPLLQDSVWREGNLTTGHRVTTRTGLPAVSRRRLNQGVAPTKGTFDQVDEGVTLVEGNSTVDVAEAELNGDQAAYRATLDNGFVQQMNNTAEFAAFYDSSKATPDQCAGLSGRFDSTSSPYGKQIVLCESGASGGDQSSVWLVGWGPQTVYMFYPKGSVGGLKVTDRGVQKVDPVGNGAIFWAYQTQFAWQFGLAVEDPRYVVRVANIDNSALDVTTTTLITAMVKAYHKTFTVGVGARFVWYMNRTVATFLHQQSLVGAKYMMTFEEVAGKMVPMFLGYPVRITDALTITEAVVS